MKNEPEMIVFENSDIAKIKGAQIIKVLTPYMAVFPNCKIDATGLLLYSKALMPLRIQDLEAAMVKLLQTCKFFPSVAEIFEAADSVNGYVEAINGSRLPTPAEAWAEAMRNVREFSLYRPWVYSCPEVEKTVEQFGRYELAMLEAKDVNIARAQFMRIYESVVSRSRGDWENRRALEALNNSNAHLLLQRIDAVKQIEGA